MNTLEYRDKMRVVLSHALRDLCPTLRKQIRDCLAQTDDSLQHMSNRCWHLGLRRFATGGELCKQDEVV